jgi:hypothetical protein
MECVEKVQTIADTGSFFRVTGVFSLDRQVQVSVHFRTATSFITEADVSHFSPEHVREYEITTRCDDDVAKWLFEG